MGVRDFILTWAKWDYARFADFFFAAVFFLATFFLATFFAAFFFAAIKIFLLYKSESVCKIFDHDHDQLSLI